MQRLTALLVALCATTALCAQSQTKPYINVSGTASMEIQPNEFYITICICEADSKGRISIKEQEQDMIAALQGVGIDTTQALHLSNSNIDYYRRTTSLATTYYELKLTDMEDVIATFDALKPLGLSDIYISRVLRSDLDEIYSQLRCEAIRDAKNRALSLATAIDQNIGTCLFINDYKTTNDFYFSTAAPEYAVVEACASNKMATRADYSYSTEYLSEKITYSVEARFELLQ